MTHEEKLREILLGILHPYVREARGPLGTPGPAGESDPGQAASRPLRPTREEAVQVAQIIAEIARFRSFTSEDVTRALSCALGEEVVVSRGALDLIDYIARDVSTHGTVLTHQHQLHPKRAEFLLYLLLPRKNRDAIIGDLHEDYYARLLPQFGCRLAKVWYWYEVSAVVSWAALRTLTRLALRLGALSGLAKVAGHIVKRLSI